MTLDHDHASQEMAQFEEDLLRIFATFRTLYKDYITQQPLNRTAAEQRSQDINQRIENGLIDDDLLASMLFDGKLAPNVDTDAMRRDFPAIIAEREQALSDKLMKLTDTVIATGRKLSTEERDEFDDVAVGDVFVLEDSRFDHLEIYAEDTPAVQDPLYDDMFSKPLEIRYTHANGEAFVFVMSPSFMFDLLVHLPGVEPGDADIEYDLFDIPLDEMRAIEARFLDHFLKLYS